MLKAWQPSQIMKSLRKLSTLATICSLTFACASRAPLTTSAAQTALRSCAGRILASDAEIQAFAGCGRVDGDLTIAGDVTSLEPLAAIEAVHGTLSVESTTRLQSLDGLERLRVATGISLHHNRELDDVTALSSLHQVSRLSLSGNPQLETLRGLEGVQTLERLSIEGSGLFTLRGLANVATVGELVVAKNRRLTELRALSTVLSAERVAIIDNPVLCGRGGLLPNLERAPTATRVVGNPVTVAETSHLTRSRPGRDEAGFASIESHSVASVK